MAEYRGLPVNFIQVGLHQSLYHTLTCTQPGGKFKKQNQWKGEKKYAGSSECQSSDKRDREEIVPVSFLSKKEVRNTVAGVSIN